MCLEARRNIDRAGIEDRSGRPLTNLGLDSLMAVELQTLFHSRSRHAHVGHAALAGNHRPRTVAELVLATLRATPAPAAPAYRVPFDRASYRWLRAGALWFLQQLHPRGPIYNVPLAVRFSGPLDPFVAARPR